jgi:hypothetical protein
MSRKIGQKVQSVPAAASVAGVGGAVPTRLENTHHLKDVSSMPNLDEMKDKAGQAGQNMQDQAGEATDAAQEKSGSMMDDVKKKMDSNGDGKFDAEDIKKMGTDAVGKVKGLFKKD